MIDADLAAQLLGALGRGRLERERPQPLLDLGLEVAGALDVGRDARELQLGTVPPALEAAETGGLLDELAPLLRLAAEDLLDAALADDRAHLAAEADVGEQLDEIRAAHRRAVDEVLALAATVQTPHERDLGERQLGERAVLVVEEQLDLAEVGRRPVLAACEEHVVGLLGPKLARSEAPRGPEQRVGDVRLPGAVRPDDDGDALLEPDLDRLGERLEAAQLDRSQMHAGRKSDGPLGRQRRRKYGTQNTFEQWTAFTPPVSVVVREEREPVDALRDRRPEEVARLVERRDRRRRARDVRAVRDPERPLVRLRSLVADQPEAVGADRERREPADVARCRASPSSREEQRTFEQCATLRLPLSRSK